MPSSTQLDMLWNLSDTVFYHEAVAFIRHLVIDEQYNPLPNTQMIGLLNISNVSSYQEIQRFIRHQRDRDWQPSKQNISMFYSKLDERFTTIKNKRLRDEFHLVQGKQNSKETAQEVNELMAFIARDFILHLIAENLLLASKEKTSSQEKGK